MMRLSHQALRRYITIALVVFIVLLLLNLAALDATDTSLHDALLLSLGITRPGRPSAPATCLLDLDYLAREEYSLSPEVVYRKRTIRVVYDDSIERFIVENITEPLIDEQAMLQQSSECEGWLGPQTPSQTLEMSVSPPFPDRRYPHMLFGVATTFDRLNQSTPQFAHWLSRSGAPLLAIIVDAKDADGRFDKLVLEYRSLGMNLIIAPPWPGQEGVNEQHFTMIRELLRHATPYTEWVAIIDDDTFFPSLYSLSYALSQFDPKLPAYLGGLSESFNAVEKHGVMAYGGAGVFLSIPLLAELEPLVDECLTEGDVAQGDGLLGMCIYKKTSTRFTVIPGLQQVDLMGDLSGFYESGRLPLSIHHWKSWHHVPIDKMAKVSYFCGDCFLQRWRFGTDTILTNGYSITVYENGTEDLAFNEIEGTWDGANELAWSLGPLRDRVETGKKSYLLMDAEQVGNNLRQLYVHRADGERDEVIELWWEW